MIKELSLNQLWRSLPTHSQALAPSDRLSTLPTLAQAYLRHTCAPGTPLARAVRLRMHGEIKLQRWLPFSAEQVISCDRGMIWQARVWMNGLPILGSDRWLEGEGAMRWKLLGLVPVMAASGPDISRSAVGRVQAESIWLPSIFWGDRVTWTDLGNHQLQVHFDTYQQPATLTLTLADSGQLETLHFQRWGNPDGGNFRLEAFGGVVEAEKTFDGHTIPTQLRIGWYFGSDRFATEGEFFRVTVDEAIFR